MSTFMETATTAAREAAAQAWTAKLTTQRNAMHQLEDEIDADPRDPRDDPRSARRPVPAQTRRRRQLRRDAATQAAWLAGLR